jgi:hypothetical protein
VLPVAGIKNARFGERARARVASVRRAIRASLGLSTLALALWVGAIQAGSLFAVHGVLPAPPLVAAIVIVLASLACLWVGTFAFVRMLTRRRGMASACLTTLAFYGRAMPLGTDEAVATLVGLVPAALIGARALVRLPWPPEARRPNLPCF